VRRGRWSRVGFVSGSCRVRVGFCVGFVVADIPRDDALLDGRLLAVLRPLPGTSLSGRRESNPRFQLGKVPEPNLSELQRCVTAGERVIHTPANAHARRRPRDIRGMRLSR